MELNPSEFLAFIPMLLYGISLSELLGQWRRFFHGEYLYWPFILTALIFTELAIWNVFSYLEIARNIVGITYYHYWVFLLLPIIFLLLVHALTPEKDNKDTEGHFRSRMTIVFGLMALYLSVHFLQGMDGASNENMSYARIVGIALCILIATLRKPALVYVLAVAWIVSLFFRM